MTSADRNRQVAVLIWSSLIVGTVLLLSRRVSGRIDSVASAWPCVLVSLLATLLSGFGWVLFQRAVAVRSPSSENIIAIVAWLPTWLCGVALLPPDSPLARGWMFGIAGLSGAGFALSVSCNPKRQRAVVAENHSLARRAGERDQLPMRVERSPESKHPDVGFQATSDPQSDLSVFDPVTEGRTDESTTQWMTRQSLPDGVDQVEGAIRVAFVAGQRAASIHVPFSPPFAAVPQVECEIVGDEPARWKLSVVYAYGMRVDLKRESGDKPTEIEVAYSATCGSTVSEAA